jgi:diguanylate cyclase (GGDEF)-like protein
MDIRGFSFGTALCIVLLYMMLTLVVTRAGDEPAYRAFRNGGICAAVGLVLNMLQGVAHPLLPFVFGNSLIVASAAWFWVGISRLTGGDGSVRRVYWLGAAMAAFGLWFGLIDPSLRGRLISNACLIGVSTAGIAWALLVNPRGRALGRAGLALGVLQAITTLLLLARVAIHLRYEIPRVNILEAHPLNAVPYVLTLIFYALFAMILNVFVVNRLVASSLALADRDALTGTLNRRGLQRALGATGKWNALLLIDVDDFKRVNDAYGHDIGDLLLQRLVEVARIEMREHDLLARIGGEEFVLVLGADERDPAAVAEGLRAQFAQAAAPLPKSSISIGVAALAAQATHDLHQQLKRADLALYSAKNSGRNRVCVAA